MAEHRSEAKRGFWYWVCGGVVTFVVVASLAVYFANLYWPFRYRNVKPLLESVLASKITIDQYHRTYFPRPGFVATGLTLRRNTAPDLPPVGSVRELKVQGSWLDLLTLRRRVQLVDIVGLQVVIPPVGSKANAEDFPPGSSADFAGPTTAVETVHMHDSELDIDRVHGGRYAFPVHDLVIRNLQKGKTISFLVDMQNPKPGGRIQSKGTFGPLNPDNLGATPVKGTFTFAPVALGDIGGLHGTLTASGTFEGPLDGVEADSDAETQDFSVGKGRPTRITVHLHSTMNGLTGDIVLHKGVLKVGRTTVLVAGTIASPVGEPKVTEADVTVKNGRTEDVLKPFLKGPAPVAGVVDVRGHARLDGAANGAKFLQRLHVKGSFEAPQEKLTDAEKEKQLSGLSERAQGEKAADVDEADVVSSVSGEVTVNQGLVSTPRLTFVMPGAEADMHGTFDLKGDKAHLLGVFKMDTDISNVTTGFKSMLLKPLAPFFKKKNKGAVVPIAITGEKGKYKVGQDILHNK